MMNAGATCATPRQRSAFSERCWWVVEHARSATPLHPPFHSTWQQPTRPSIQCHSINLPSNLRSRTSHHLLSSRLLTFAKRPLGFQREGTGLFARREALLMSLSYRTTVSLSHLSTPLYLIHANRTTTNCLTLHANGSFGCAMSVPRTT